RDEGNAGARQVPDGRPIEMVVVIVRDDHRVEWRKRGQCGWWRVEPLGAGEGHWRCAGAPDRVRQDRRTVDLHEEGRVAEPGDPKACLGGPAPRRDRIDEWQRAGRGPSFSAAQEVAHRRTLDPLFEARGNRTGVDEDAAVEPRRGFDALEAQAVGT